MTSDKLPAVLVAPRGSISLERALKQMRRLLTDAVAASAVNKDHAEATFDDLETMLKAIQR